MATQIEKRNEIPSPKRQEWHALGSRLVAGIQSGKPYIASYHPKKTKKLRWWLTFQEDGAIDFYVCDPASVRVHPLDERTRTPKGTRQVLNG